MVSVQPDPALLALADAPEGAVMNFPVVGGRPYLYEQTIHRKPIAGTLNFPNNGASRKVWAAILAARSDSESAPETFRTRVSQQARRSGVRYVVVHFDASVRPDMHDEAVRALSAAFEPLPVAAVDATVPESLSPIEVYRLW